MQREKLYNLQTKVYFNNILFVFKKMQKSVQPIFAIVKKIVFLQQWEFLLLILFFYRLLCFFKRNKIYYKMQLEKLYSFQRTVYSICILFMLKKLQGISTWNRPPIPKWWPISMKLSGFVELKILRIVIKKNF